MRQKILFAIDSFPGPIGGTEGQLLTILRRLKRDEFEPHILLLRHSEFLETECSSIPQMVLGIDKLASFSAFLKVFKLAVWVRRQRFDVVHTFFNDTSLILPIPMAFAGARVVISRRDEGFWYNRRILAILRLNRMAVSAVAANSNAVSCAVQKHEGYLSEKIFVVHNGIGKDCTFIETKEARRLLGLSKTEDLFVFGIVANLRPLKRISDAIKALSQIVGGHDADVCLVIAGEDRCGGEGPSHLAELKLLAESCGVEDRVVFLGYQSDLTALYSAVDAGLCCSDTEGLSNAIMEFQVMGKPVIATNAGGNAELIDDGKNGYLFDIGDVTVLSKKMGHLLEDRGKTYEFGQNARARVSRDFSIDTMMRGYRDIYRTLCNVTR